jgi:serine/threonine protein phosphatase PrpC
MQGWRVGMEDSHIAREIDLPGKQKGVLFAVFDGHGGKEVAMFAEKHFTTSLTSNSEFKKGNFENALR